MLRPTHPATANPGLHVFRTPALAIGLSLFACASSTEQKDPLPGEGAIQLERGESLPSFAPAETAEGNWARGEEAFEDEDFLLAQRYYFYIRRKFPYKKYAALSHLRIADCQFERENYKDAIFTYQDFVKLNPAHPEVPYALFRTGKAHHELVPNDWFFLPASYEKDQQEIRETEQAFARYLERYPNHANADEARTILTKVRKKLIAHERYVADFYEREGRIRGYVGRLERIKTQFPEVGKDPKLLLEIVEAYVRLEDAEAAQKTLEELESSFPNATKEARRARRALRKLIPRSAEPANAPG